MTDMDSAPTDDTSSQPPSPGPDASTVCTPRPTRASAIWVATGAALVLVILLIVFMLRNSAKATLHFLGLSGTVPLGLALLIAAVGGGVLVAIAGIARVTQLRRAVRRTVRTATAP